MPVPYGLANLDGIACFKNAEEVDLDNRRMADIGPMRALAHVRKLNLRQNRLTDLSALAGMTALEELDFSDNQVSDLSPLRQLTRLKKVAGRNNKVVSLEALAGLLALEELDLSQNRIASIAPLVGLKQLRTLRLDRNAVTDFKLLRKGKDPLHDEYNQYRGSCLQIMRDLKAGRLQRPLKNVFAICPEWEDDATAVLFDLPREGCRVSASAMTSSVSTVGLR